ncbi:hypothetical protein GDO81_002443 [Engystomops pustulosus]|uniref:Uncharacterized protein n=1 Tax=Engystomops pustulosus TaxID=76066 RepID=A0AAV7DLA2_ENGPU|nr:hypothetical protein GDO81_002443 [Engystomops pustulosus]
MGSMSSGTPLPPHHLVVPILWLRFIALMHIAEFDLKNLVIWIHSLVHSTVSFWHTSYKRVAILGCAPPLATFLEVGQGAGVKFIGAAPCAGYTMRPKLYYLGDTRKLLSFFTIQNKIKKLMENCLKEDMSPKY